jgi:ribosome-associated protein
MYDSSPMNHDEDPYENEFEPPSKSQLKREAESVQQMGKSLVELPAARYAAVMAKLDLPEALHEAIAACRAINARGGRKRQLQYIGKLMRGIDAEPVRSALAALEGRDRTETAQLHRLERWRERLIAEGDGALAELLDEYPAADRQRLRQLTAKARKERDAGQSPAAARALFRALRELFDGKTEEEQGGSGVEE